MVAAVAADIAAGIAAVAVETGVEAVKRADVVYFAACTDGRGVLEARMALARDREL